MKTIYFIINLLLLIIVINLYFTTNDILSEINDYNYSDEWIKTINHFQNVIDKDYCRDLLLKK